MIFAKCILHNQFPINKSYSINGIIMFESVEASIDLLSFWSGSPWNNSSGCEDERRPQGQKVEKKSNTLPLWGNERTMNLNPLILTNIQSSHYFKVNLYELKTYHEVIDEIYYKVAHLEPWEKGSRKTAGQTGMCGGVSNSDHCLLLFFLSFLVISRLIESWVFFKFYFK